MLENMQADTHLLETIEAIVNCCTNCLASGNKLLLAGNGGSAADAQHIAGEYISRFMFDRPGLPAIALTTDTSVITSISNDYGYEYVFQRQIEALATSGDIFIAYSTSGNSSNIVKSLQKAQSKNVITVGMTGNTNGSMVDFCDYIIKIPSASTPRIQEGHAIIGHYICEQVEKNIFGKE